MYAPILPSVEPDGQELMKECQLCCEWYPQSVFDEVEDGSGFSMFAPNGMWVGRRCHTCEQRLRSAQPSQGVQPLAPMHYSYQRSDGTVVQVAPMHYSYQRSDGTVVQESYVSGRREITTVAGDAPEVIVID